MFLFLLIFSVSLFGGEVLSPTLGYSVHDQYLKHLHSIFTKLNKEEQSTDWGKEYTIGLQFAKELDLYQAITAFKRAVILIPDDEITRRRELDYQIINAYYLGGKYKEAIAFFDHSLLANIEPSFPAFHDLLIILYDSLENDKDKDRAARMLKIMDRYFPLEKKKLELGNSLLSGDIDLIAKKVEDNFIETSIASLEDSLDSNFYKESTGALKVDEKQHGLAEDKLHSLYHLKECTEAMSGVYNDYQSKRKSPYLAGGLNAVLPGLGYLYLGQKQSALTALLLNSFTVGASYYFFKSDNIPAALLTLSFESGWYFGGIYGAKQEADFFNKRTFEDATHYRMRDHKLYPILMLRHGF